MRIAAAACLALAGLTTVAGQNPRNAKWSAALLLINASEYFGVTYAALPAPNATYVYFLPGEAVKVRVDIANPGTEAVQLVLPGSGPQAAFALRSTGTIGMRTNDTVVLRRTVGRPERWTWQPRLDLGPREVLQIDLELVGQLPPGEYVVDFDTKIADNAGRAVTPQSNRFQFEVRAPSGAESEIAWRNASRAFMRGDDQLAEQWIQALFRVNSESYAAHALRGQIADRAGDYRTALRHYREALLKLEAGSDTQYNRRHDSRALSAAQEGMRSIMSADRFRGL